MLLITNQHQLSTYSRAIESFVSVTGFALKVVNLQSQIHSWMGTIAIEIINSDSNLSLCRMR